MSVLPRGFECFRPPPRYGCVQGEYSIYHKRPRCGQPRPQPFQRECACFCGYPSNAPRERSVARLYGTVYFICKCFILELQLIQCLILGPVVMTFLAKLTASTTVPLHAQAAGTLEQFGIQGSVARRCHPVKLLPVQIHPIILAALAQLIKLCEVLRIYIKCY